MPIVATSALLLAAGTCQSPASAAGVDILQIAGAGTIWPGLTVLPQPQAFGFGGDALTVGTQTGHWICDFAGNGLDDNYASGVGTFGGSCGPINLPLCVYVRSGVELTVICLDTGPHKAVLHGHFVFTPDQIPPSTVTSYHLQGAAFYFDAT